MLKNVIHISESEAASDFALVMTRVREGAEVIIERDAKAVAVGRLGDAVRGRPISESIALVEAHAKELGYEPTMPHDELWRSLAGPFHDPLVGGPYRSDGP